MDLFTILFCIGIGHSQEGVVQFSNLEQNTFRRLVHYSTMMLLHNSLVTCENKLTLPRLVHHSFIVVLHNFSEFLRIDYISPWFWCTISTRFPKTWQSCVELFFVYLFCNNNSTEHLFFKDVATHLEAKCEIFTKSESQNGTSTKTIPLYPVLLW